MKVAVEGCCHGELVAIYDQVKQLEKQNGYKVDLLLICGDFQAVRNHQDLQCMAVPPKYRRLGEFYKYYTGEAVAPMLTIVIGGNHEASNYFWELYHGGWLAPNIYFLGHAGCVQVNGVRIAGASGIFKGYDFQQGHWEHLPYDQSTIKSIYHIREYNIRRLSLLTSPHIFLSHDWPQGIERHGNINDLLRRKPFFKQDIESGHLGSPPLMNLMRNLKPAWWFAAHLHVRFEAVVTHNAGPPPSDAPAPIPNPDEIVIDDEPLDSASSSALTAVVEAPNSGVDPVSRNNPDEIMLEDEEEQVAPPPPPPPPRSETKFLALDKCLPRRKFLEVIDVPVAPEFAETNPPILSYDAEWLAITRAFQPYFSLVPQQPSFPDEAQAWEMVEKEYGWVMENVGKKLTADETQASRPAFWRVDSCQKFVMTAPGGPKQERPARNGQPPAYTNPQTEAFADMLGIENQINPRPHSQTGSSGQAAASTAHEGVH